MKVVASIYEDIPAWRILAKEILPLFGPHGSMRAFTHMLREHIACGTAFCIPEENEMGLVGGLLFEPGSPHVIAWLGVAERYRRQGAGTLLVRRALELVNPPAVIEVKTFGPGLQRGIPARCLYKKMGFVPTETVSDLPPDEPRQIFRCVLERKDEC